MKHFESRDAVLDFAIKNEDEAREFYLKLASSSKNEDMKKVFEEFAQEEGFHKDKLQKIKAGKAQPADPTKKIADMKIADYVVDVEPNPNLDYQGALMLAMKKEKAAFRLYSDLAKIADEQELRDIFASLAQEEAKHKLRFELEYDQEILKEN
jgi:rubrerythrin